MISMEKEELGFKFIINKIINLLGGYTKKDFLEYKKNISRRIKNIKLSEKLTEDEKLVLNKYRTDMLFHKGIAPILSKYRKKN